MSGPAKNFLIYSASAGSGKTFTLVSAYLQKILEPGGSFSKVLAITFTNKATAEMKSRIIKELSELAAGNPSAHLDVLVKNSGENESIIRTRAGIQLKKMLHDYSAFSVSTIDSYFQLLTKTLTRELQIPVKFDLELNEEKVRHEITARLLARAGNDKDITVWLRDLLFDKLEQGKGWKIQPELRKLVGEVLHQAEARALAEGTDHHQIRKFIEELYSIKNTFIADLRSIANEAVKQMQERNYTADDFSYKNDGAAGYFRKLLDNDSSKWEVKVRVKDALENPGKFLNAEGKKNKDLLAFVNEILHPLLDQAVEIYKAGIIQYNSADAVLRLIYYTGLIPAIGEELKIFRDEKQQFLISDTTRLLADNVAGQDAPFIFEKSGIRYRHVFIDEFQDTGNDQWNILLPLARNTLANGDQLLLVGDAKQSIYRWRGGNIHLIRRVAEENLSAFRSVLEKKFLETNWRSGENIVSFNNALFPLLAQAFQTQFTESADEELRESYSADAVKQQSTEKNKDKGYVEFIFFKSADKKKNSEEGIPSPDWKEKALIQLKDTIDSCIRDGFRAEDIAILFRTNAEESVLAGWLLNETGYPFISSNSLKLNLHPGVRFIINCLSILSGRDQPVNRSEAEQFLLQQHLTRDNSIIPHARLRYFENGSWFNDVLMPLKADYSHMPLPFLISLLREKGNLLHADPFIDAFEDQAGEYAGKYSGSADDFLTWWEEQLETKEFFLEMPETSEAIRLLSIHKSKGLEFPVVIIPFCDWKIVPDFRTRLWAGSNIPPFNQVSSLQVAASSVLRNSVFEKSYLDECKETLSDNLNITYVAFTRPKERLYAFSTSKGEKNYISTYLHESVISLAMTESEITEGHERYILGKKEKHPVKADKESTPNSLYNPESVPVARPLIKAAISQPELAVSVQSTEIAFGKALHEVIAYYQPGQNFEHEIAKAALKFRISKNELEPAVERTLLLMHERGWLSEKWKVYPETDISDEAGELHRPDRVLCSETETIVLDFKTGQPSPAYSRQVIYYCNLLTSIGLPSVKGYLIYPVAGLVEEAG